MAPLELKVNGSNSLGFVYLYKLTAGTAIRALLKFVLFSKIKPQNRIKMDLISKVC